MHDFDLIIIGAGPAGEKAAIQGSALGAKVAIIERANVPGGASVVTGTIPSKAIRETVCYISVIKKKHLHGLDMAVSHEISMPDLLHRQYVIATSITDRILDDFKTHNITYIQGDAKFIDWNSFSIITNTRKDIKEELKLSAPKIIIASGSKPFHPRDVVFDNKFILDSDSLLQIEEIPKSIIIYGGGVVGCEYASIFSELGVKTYLISPQGTLLSFLDTQISLALTDIYKTKGVQLYLGDQYKTISVVDNKVQLVLHSGEVLVSDCLLYANGRQGNSQYLDLAKCGIISNSRDQLDVNDFFQTKVPHIYAVGDIIGFPALASVANEQGRCAASHALQGYFDYRNLKSIPIGIYTIPEVAMVGETEKSLQEKHISYEVGISHFKEIAKAEMLGEKDGLLKLLFDKNSKKLLGVHIIGNIAPELIHIGQAVIHYQGSLDYFLLETINFPTLSSAYKAAAIDGNSKLSSRYQLNM